MTREGSNPRLPAQGPRATLQILTKNPRNPEKSAPNPLTSQCELKAQANSSSNLLPDWITSLPSPKQHSQPPGAPRSCTQCAAPLLPLLTKEHLEPWEASTTIQIPPFCLKRSTQNPEMCEFLLSWVAGAILSGLGKDFILGRPLGWLRLYLCSCSGDQEPQGAEFTQAWLCHTPQQQNQLVIPTKGVFPALPSLPAEDSAAVSRSKHPLLLHSN